MKKHLYILTFCLLVISASSCKKWLDVKPGAQVLQDDLFSSESGFNQALLGCYLQMGTGLYADNMTMTTVSAMAQNYQYVTGHQLLDVGRYNYAAPVAKSTIETIWGNMYRAIGSVNNILTHIDKSRGVFLKDHYNLVKGEAMGLRAYMHFDLLRLFGPIPINNASANAIPYIRTFDRMVTQMSTTGQVIASCLKDLDEAEQLLSVSQEIVYAGNNSDEFVNYTRNHFNYWAVKALKARIYLYAGEKAKAYQYATEVIASAKFPFVNRATFSLTANQDRTFSTEHIFALNLPLIKPLVDLRFRLEGNTTFQASTFYLPSATMNTLYEIASGGSTDYRYLHLIRSYNGFSYSTKFWQDGLTNLEVSNQMPLIRLSEMYYIAAEATPDLVEARNLINQIRINRGLEALTSSFNENIRMDEIAKEYNKEFYAEGQLFFYYKRLGILPLPRSSVAMTAQTYVLPLPDAEIEFGNR